MHPTVPVKRLDGRDALAELGPYPAILTGAVDAWPARSSWTIESLAARLGELTDPVHRWVAKDFNTGLVMEEMTLRRYAELLRAGRSDLHVSGYGLLRDAPELWADIERPRWVRRFERWHPTVFLSPRGMTTPLHYDLF